MTLGDARMPTRPLHDKWHCVRCFIHTPHYLLPVLLTGCALAQTNANGLPYEAWRIGFLAPSNMDAWLETANVKDVKGRYFFGAMAGSIAINFGGDPAGWRQPVGWGAGRYLMNAALPERVVVRWQSLVEPQTYSAVLQIPESARRLMLKKAPFMHSPNRYAYQEALAIGLAPGGWIRVWVKGPGTRPVEVLCQKAQIEP